MVDKIAENKYISYMMNKLPEEQAKTETYTLQKGESLWEVAKNAISNDKKASNAEISEYMLRIAKLNGLDSYEKMNSVKANTKLYMPDKIEKTRNNPNQKTKERSSAEQSALEIMSILFNDKTISVQRPRLGFKSTLYHVYKQPEKYGPKKVVMTFQMPENGKLHHASFEDINENINTIGYDYNLDSKGHIYKNKYNFNGEQKGQLTKEEITKLEAKLNELRSIASPIM